MNADITVSANETHDAAGSPIQKSPTLRKSLKANLNKNKIISFEETKNQP